MQQQSPHPSVLICEGFPRVPTQADIDALTKRAADAEYHLRREVASNQALVAEVESLRAALADANKKGDLLREALADRHAVIESMEARIEHTETALTVANLEINRLAAAVERDSISGWMS